MEADITARELHGFGQNSEPVTPPRQPVMTPQSPSSAPLLPASPSGRYGPTGRRLTMDDLAVLDLATQFEKSLPFSPVRVRRVDALRRLSSTLSVGSGGTVATWDGQISDYYMP